MKETIEVDQDSEEESRWLCKSTFYQLEWKQNRDIFECQTRGLEACYSTESIYTKYRSLTGSLTKALMNNSNK